MNTISVSNFRNNMAASLNRVDNGESILIRRNKQLYAIIPVSEDELTVTPELQEKINEARKAYRNHECIECSTHEELDEFFNSL
ncbi:hypothetical protein [uncultured Duncaniella sp.]|uniref:type II toxin-antitoxin system Phd/YefM family antitoxin n=1 Tax=uncultured Duncaniella sp. TaxID=2768039 RepID=UPI0025F5F13F|nr:hypothetical protein [uncultured Duncaniella sp.]